MLRKYSKDLQLLLGKLGEKRFVPTLGQSFQNLNQTLLLSKALWHAFQWEHVSITEQSRKSPSWCHPLAPMAAHTVQIQYTTIFPFSATNAWYMLGLTPLTSFFRLRIALEEEYLVAGNDVGDYIDMVEEAQPGAVVEYFSEEHTGTVRLLKLPEEAAHASMAQTLDSHYVQTIMLTFVKRAFTQIAMSEVQIGGGAAQAGMGTINQDDLAAFAAKREQELIAKLFWEELQKVVFLRVAMGEVERPIDGEDAPPTSGGKLLRRVHRVYREEVALVRRDHLSDEEAAEQRFGSL